MGDIGPLVASPEGLRRPTSDIVAATYDRLQRELFTFALRATRDRAAAEDLLQEAFTRLSVEIEAGRTPLNSRAWLYRVVANLAVSRRRREAVADRGLGSLAHDGTDSGPEPTYLDHERKVDIDTVLGGLDADARTALLMAASGFNGMEIAEAIGRSGTATRTMMCGARLQLRRRLDQLGPAA